VRWKIVRVQPVASVMCYRDDHLGDERQQKIDELVNLDSQLAF